MLELKEINEQAKLLQDRIIGINEWISANPNTDPDYYEFVDCLIQFGELTWDVCKYFDQNGWPTFKEKDETMTHYNSWQATSELENCYKELQKLSQVRKINQEGFSNPNTNPDVYNFLSDLRARCAIGEYFAGDSMEYRRLKKELICKSFSVPFYIWQVKQKDPSYQYDNITEFEMMQQYRTMNAACYPEQETIHYSDGTCYVGPQFGEHLDKMFEYIEHNYKYMNTKKESKENSTAYVKKS